MKYGSHPLEKPRGLLMEQVGACHQTTSGDEVESVGAMSQSVARDAASAWLDELVFDVRHVALGLG
jgi:hypothetical protein